MPISGSVVDQIISQSRDIDVYVIIDPAPGARTIAPRPLGPHRPLRRYLLSAALVVIATLLAKPLTSFLSPTNLIMLYLVAVIVAAVYLGSGPSMLAAILGVVAFDFFFVPPYLSFSVSDSEYLLTFVGLLLVGIVISSLMTRVRNQAISAEQRESQAVQLYEVSRDLAGAGSLDSIVRVVLAHMSQTFGRDAVVLLPEGGRLQMHSLAPSVTLDENELAVADWVYKHGQSAGRGTDTLPAARIRYLPLKTAQGVLGVMGITPAEPSAPLSPEKRRLLEAFASQAALAIERAQLAERTRQMQILQATEQLQSALLNSISHEFRTPLVAITGALSSLRDDAGGLDEEARRNLAADGYEEAEQLNRLVGNLLNMTRIEAGALRVHAEPCDVEEVIGTALERISNRLEDREVKVNVAPALAAVPMDPGLIVQVLVNLLDNAVKYSPAASPITMAAREAAGNLEVAVTDQGKSGVQPEDLVRALLRQILPGAQAGQRQRHRPGSCDL